MFFVIDKENRKKNVELRSTFRKINSNSRLKKFLLVWFVNSLANVLPMILFSFYITYVLGGDDYDRQKTLFFYFFVCNSWSSIFGHN